MSNENLHKSSEDGEVAHQLSLETDDDIYQSLEAETYPDDFYDTLDNQEQRSGSGTFKRAREISPESQLSDNRNSKLFKSVEGLDKLEEVDGLGRTPPKKTGESTGGTGGKSPIKQKKATKSPINPNAGSKSTSTVGSSSSATMGANAANSWVVNINSFSTQKKNPINVLDIYNLERTKFDGLDENILSNLVVGGKKLQEEINRARTMAKKYITFMGFSLNVSKMEGDIVDNELTKQRFYACLNIFLYQQKKQGFFVSVPSSPLIHKADLSNSQLSLFSALLGSGYHFVWRIFMPIENNKMKYNNFHLYILGAKLLDYLSYMNRVDKSGEEALGFIEFLKNVDDRQSTVLAASVRNMGDFYNSAVLAEPNWTVRFLQEANLIKIDRDATKAKKMAANIDRQIVSVVTRVP